MEFDAALQAAQIVIDMAPDSPAGYYYRAAIHWQWRLVARDPQQRAALLQRLQEDMRRTLDVAQKLPAARAAEAAFYLGAAYGTQARVSVVEKQYFKALGAAKKGGAYLQRCVELDPTWHDAYLGLGVYHYFLARVPGFVRGLAQWLVGLEGNRDRGLQELEHSYTHGLLTRPEAASVLARIYASSAEKQYEKARQLLAALAQQYPQNIDYRYRLLLVLAQQEDWPQAVYTGRALETDLAQGKLAYAFQWLPLIRYRLAEMYVLQGEADTAWPILHTLQVAPYDATLHPWVYVRLGNVADLRGNHDAAREFYQRVTEPDDARELAAQYSTSPFGRGSRAPLKPPEKMI